VTSPYWIVLVIAVLAAAGVGIGLVVTRRSRRELARRDDTASLPPGTGVGTVTDTDDDVNAGATDSAVATAGLDDLLDRSDDTLVDEPLVSEPDLERPERPADRWTRLRSRLAGSQTALGRGLLQLLSRDRIDDQTWDDLEETLLTADVGVTQSTAIVDALRRRVRVEGIATPAAIRAAMREELIAALSPASDRSLHTVRGEKPAVVLVVGVNGTGKTTTVGKLARVLVADDRDVVLAAADTFRAAAADQLTTWGDRVGVPTVRGPEGGDPASVAFDAVRAGIEGESDVVIIDTAGRLHTKAGLMDELGKIKRVVEKQAPVTEVLLVLDATTGQNGLVQARVFGEIVAVTGVVLTKLDGSAKGGIVFAVQQELGVPVKLVGLGEGVDDMAPFVPADFVDALLG
jgi:fused signal recognition particle receptor